jgi:hypothetical protein
MSRGLHEENCSADRPPIQPKEQFRTETCAEYKATSFVSLAITALTASLGSVADTLKYDWTLRLR